MDKLDQFLHLLRNRPAMPNVFRPWSDFDPALDASIDAPDQRTEHLRSYLRQRLESARLILVAEAPGYQGARFSGIAMTCERTLLGRKRAISADNVLQGRKARTSKPMAGQSSTVQRHGFCEPTATIVWRAMLERMPPNEFVLWNTFPFHPHRAGEPLSNRTPSATELAREGEVLKAILRLFQGCLVVPIGEKARAQLSGYRNQSAAVRHPANGGATDFRSGMRKIIDTLLTDTNRALPQSE